MKKWGQEKIEWSEDFKCEKKDKDKMKYRKTFHIMLSFSILV